MQAIEPGIRMTQADFTRHRKVSSKAVTVWKEACLLVLDEAGNIEVEETEWRISTSGLSPIGVVFPSPDTSWPRVGGPATK